MASTRSLGPFSRHKRAHGPSFGRFGPTYRASRNFRITNTPITSSLNLPRAFTERKSPRGNASTSFSACVDGDRSRLEHSERENCDAFDRQIEIQLPPGKSPRQILAKAVLRSLLPSHIIHADGLSESCRESWKVRQINSKVET